MRLKLAMILGVALAMGACGSEGGEEQAAEAPHESEVAGTTVTMMSAETTTEEPQTTPPTTQPEESTVGDSTGSAGKLSSAAQLERAKEDLAQRLDVDQAQVSVVTQREIVWPNGALGCPEEGMMYTQALVDGSLVILEVDGQEYEYHGAVGKPLKYCANPAPRK